MERVGDAIFEILSNDSNIQSLLGVSAGDKIYQNLASQANKDKMYIRFYTTGATPTDHKDGPSIIDDMIVNVDCFGERERDTELLNQYVRVALDRHPHGTVAGIELEGTQFLRSHMMPMGADAADKYHYASIFKFRVGRPTYLVPVSP